MNIDEGAGQEVTLPRGLGLSPRNFLTSNVLQGVFVSKRLISHAANSELLNGICPPHAHIIYTGVWGEAPEAEAFHRYVTILQIIDRHLVPYFCIHIFNTSSRTCMSDVAISFIGSRRGIYGSPLRHFVLNF